MISLLDYTAGGRVFEFGDGTNTQGLKLSEKLRYCVALQTTRSSCGSDEHVKCAKYIDTQIKCIW